MGRVFHSLITDATVQLFGSSGSGFALTSSNVNLSVSTVGTSANQVQKSDVQHTSNI